MGKNPPDNHLYDKRTSSKENTHESNIVKEENQSYEATNEPSIVLR